MKRDDPAGPVSDLTSAQRAALEQVAADARRWLRAQEEEERGCVDDDAGARPSVLFAGADREVARRTAQCLARQLGRDLYRVNVGLLVSRFTGETEKNLGRALETAERTGAVLLFDESDALFGQRTVTRGDPDRYANVDINYLEQRLAAFHGLAILACRGSLAELGSGAQHFDCVIELA
jgi:hypothetical protein